MLSMAAYTHSMATASLLARPLGHVLHSVRLPAEEQQILNIIGVAQSVTAVHTHKAGDRKYSKEAILCVLHVAISMGCPLFFIYDNCDIDKLVDLAIHILVGLVYIGEPAGEDLDVPPTIEIKDQTPERLAVPGESETLALAAEVGAVCLEAAGTVTAKFAENVTNLMQPEKLRQKNDAARVQRQQTRRGRKKAPPAVNPISGEELTQVRHAARRRRRTPPCNSARPSPHLTSPPPFSLHPSHS